VAVGAALCAALLAFAFVAAPKSCDWGLGAYFWAGLALLAVVATLPFVFGMGASTLGRAGLAVAFAAAVFGVWAAGLFAANFQILCRLF